MRKCTTNHSYLLFSFMWGQVEIKNPKYKNAVEPKARDDKIKRGYSFFLFKSFEPGVIYSCIPLMEKLKCIWNLLINIVDTFPLTMHRNCYVTVWSPDVDTFNYQMLKGKLSVSPSLVLVINIGVLKIKHRYTNQYIHICWTLFPAKGQWKAYFYPSFLLYAVVKSLAHVVWCRKTSSRMLTHA